MVAVFGDYARYYDNLYREKDYEAESDFLEEIFDRYAQGPIRTILDLGCGTGGHALPLAQRGYTVTGVDRSETMLAEARCKVKAVAQGTGACDFVRGDIRNLDLGRTFDAVIALFAVMSYQTSNNDVAATLATVRRHLATGGLFVCDFWFGPAVLFQRPGERAKTVEQRGHRIIRLAKPTLDVLTHTVRVDYQVLWLQDNEVLNETYESHLMRFFFPQELAYFADQAGLRMKHLCPFMALDRRPSEEDWNVTAIMEAR